MNVKRKRQRIGSPLSTAMKKVAHDVYAKRRAEVAEGRFIDRKREPTCTFDDLVEAYVAWIQPNEPKGTPAQKRSWRSGDPYAIGKLHPYFTGKCLADITPAMVSQYQAHRSASLSRFGKPVRPATVNRELAILRGMSNAAQRGVLLMKGSVPEKNPVTARLSFAKEHNERDTVISPEELQRLMEASPAWL